MTDQGIEDCWTFVDPTRALPEEVRFKWEINGVRIYDLNGLQCAGPWPWMHVDSFSSTCVPSLSDSGEEEMDLFEIAITGIGNFIFETESGEAIHKGVEAAKAAASLRSPASKKKAEQEQATDGEATDGATDGETDGETLSGAESERFGSEGDTTVTTTGGETTDGETIADGEAKHAAALKEKEAAEAAAEDAKLDALIQQASAKAVVKALAEKAAADKEAAEKEAAEKEAAEKEAAEKEAAEKEKAGVEAAEKAAAEKEAAEKAAAEKAAAEKEAAEKAAAEKEAAEKEAAEKAAAEKELMEKELVEKEADTAEGVSKKEEGDVVDATDEPNALEPADESNAMEIVVAGKEEGGGEADDDESDTTPGSSPRRRKSSIKFEQDAITRKIQLEDNKKMIRNRQKSRPPAKFDSLSRTFSIVVEPANDEGRAVNAAIDGYPCLLYGGGPKCNETKSVLKILKGVKAKVELVQLVETKKNKDSVEATRQHIMRYIGDRSINDKELPIPVMFVGGLCWVVNEVKLTKAFEDGSLEKCLSKAGALDATAGDAQSLITVMKQAPKKPKKKGASPAVEPTCAFLEIGIGGKSVGTLDITLFDSIAPKACKNFRALCEGWKDPAGKGSLHYKDSIFYRACKGMGIEGGDVKFSHTGAGGSGTGEGEGEMSIFAGNFEDESNELRYSQPGLLALVNNGRRDTNSSRFIITTVKDALDPARKEDGQNPLRCKMEGHCVVFGKVETDMGGADKGTVNSLLARISYLRSYFLSETNTQKQTQTNWPLHSHRAYMRMVPTTQCTLRTHYRRHRQTRYRCSLPHFLPPPLLISLLFSLLRLACSRSTVLKKIMKLESKDGKPSKTISILNCGVRSRAYGNEPLVPAAEKKGAEKEKDVQEEGGEIDGKEKGGKEKGGKEKAGKEKAGKEKGGKKKGKADEKVDEKADACIDSSLDNGQDSTVSTSSTGTSSSATSSR
jgi:cyclophilin family peptidyl-prolyl cis-trans isomerase